VKREEENSRGRNGNYDERMMKYKRNKKSIMLYKY